MIGESMSTSDIDAGMPSADSGMPPSDSGAPGTDASMRPARDSGTESDAGEIPDAGGPPDAGGTPDAGGVPDAGGTPDAGTTLDSGSSSECGTATEQEELRLTNLERAAVGASPLTCDPLLTEVARAHSRDMCEQMYFDHTALDGRSPFDRMHDAGVTYSAAGENIAAGQSTPAAVNDAWVHSPGHYSNMISTSYHKIGIGHWPCPGGEYSVYWTQNFTN